MPMSERRISEMSFLKLLFDIFDYRPPQWIQRPPHQISSNRPSRNKRIVVKRGGRLKTYRINKYGEVFEEK
jgi:hypothetical protein